MPELPGPAGPAPVLALARAGRQLRRGFRSAAWSPAWLRWH